jgi:hypothetical protein
MAKGKTNGTTVNHPLAGQPIPNHPGQFYPSTLPAPLNPYFHPFAVVNAENNKYLDENGQA